MNGRRLNRGLLGFTTFVTLAAACDRPVTEPDRQPPEQDAPLGHVNPAPANIAHTLLTAGNHTVNQKVYSTAAISPAPNALITVAVLGHRSAVGVDPPLGAPPSPTVSGGGMTTWAEVATITFDGVDPALKRLTIYRAMSAAPGSGPLTITFSNNVSNCQWIVSQWNGVDPSGVNGAGAIGQIGSSRGEAVSGLAVPLTAFANPNNVAYGVFGVRSQVLTVTPGAGFTELSEQPSAESPPSDLMAEGAINVHTITATWTNLNGGALGVEIKAAAATPPPPSTAGITRTLLTAGNHTANQKVYTTAAISPAPNALITVAVLGHRSAVGVDPPLGAPPSPTLSGAGMTTWTEVATLTFDGDAPALKRLTIYRAMSAAPGSGPLTITFSNNVSNTQWIVSQWTGVDPSGVNGAGAIGQIDSRRGEAVSGLAVPLAAFGNPNNVAYGVFGVRSQVLAVTPGAGFTELSEQPSAEWPPSDLMAEAATDVPTIAATWPNLNGAALGVEIKAAAVGGAPVLPVMNGLAAWYKADGITSLADGAPVAMWRDESGNERARHVTQATASRQPTYRTNVQNGLPVVRFDGTDDWLQTAPFNITQPTTVFVAVKYSGPPNQDRVIFDATAGATFGQNRQIIYRDFATNDWSYYAGTEQFSGTEADLGWHVLEAVFDGASSLLVLDGVTISTAVPGTGSMDLITIGAQGDGATPWLGDIGELVYYSRRLTVEERQQVENYLLTKYGIRALGGGSVLPVTNGLAAWYKADGITSLADGAPVAMWRDESDNERHVTQATASRQPTYRTNAQNGLPVVRFDGADDWLQTVPPFNIPQPTTVFVAAKYSGPPNQDRVIFDATFSPNRQIIYRDFATNDWSYYAGTERFSGTEADLNWHVLEAVFDGVSSLLVLDGVTISTADPGPGSMDLITIGSQRDGGLTPWLGDIAELVYYSRRLTVEERQQVETYLMAKYGIP